MVRLKAGLAFGFSCLVLSFGEGGCVLGSAPFPPPPTKMLCYFSLLEEPHKKEEKVQPCRLYILVALKMIKLYVIPITHDIPKMQ